VSIEVRSGRPNDEIVAAAANLGAGLIVMATHGRSGFSRLVFGSNAERVLQRSRSPLLLIRPDGEAAQDGVPAKQAPGMTRLTGPTSTTPALWSLTAKDIMTSPPIVAREDSPVSKIVTTMLDHDIGSIPVVGSRGEMVGMVSESDFVASDQCVPITAFQVPQCFERYLTDDALDDIHAAGELLTAGQVMAHDVVAVTEDESVMSVARKLLSPRVRRVPVLRDGIPVGIIAERDLLKLLVPGASERMADD
jgi:CBS domain-containing protein